MTAIAERLTILRNIMAQKNIDAWIVPSVDAHQSEYVADHWKSRQWISGFTGSAGIVVITQSHAGLWTDSRYFLQAETELAGSGIELFKHGLKDTPSYTEWLKKNLTDESIIGFDGALMSICEVDQLIDDLSPKNICLSYNEDLIDLIWHDRPAIPRGEIFELDESFTGESRLSKFDRIRHEMAKNEGNCHLVTTLDDIAWIFNIRGADIDYNPVAIAYAVIEEEKILIFIDENKVPADVKLSLDKDGVIIHKYDEILQYLRKFNDKHRLILDFNKVSRKLKDAIPDTCQLIQKLNIATELKTVKNNIEIEGIKKAHIRDGVAMVRWMVWLESNIGKVKMDEVSVGDKLEEFRQLGENYIGLSFSTIIGYKGNGAIVHYTAKKESAAILEPDGLLLVDSGAQYLDGTTDITRTISLGNVTEEQKNAYTTVLKGHVCLSKAIFPQGYNGSQIDTFSRGPIWETGYNYGHGTGHGVGHFLNVHEGPQQIRPTNTYEIKVGMLNSNEPGMYLEGKFGIRIENLIVTVIKDENQYGTFLGFDTVTLCPYDSCLIDEKRLCRDEILWLNQYHQMVFDTLSPYLDDLEVAWLRKKTKEI